MKSEGLESALAAMRYWRAKNQVMANNLANVGSPGFKAQFVFARLLPGDRPEAVAELDLSAGPLKETRGPLDVAIKGDGFFVVDTPAGERLTRRGAFELDSYGYLVDLSGNPVLGEAGAIVIPPGGEIQIEAAGDIYVVHENGDGFSERLLVDRLRIVVPEPGTRLTPEAGVLLRPEGRVLTVPAHFRGLQQGFVEESNVESVSALNTLIEIQRNYVSAQHAVETLDHVAGTIVNDIARPT